MSRDLRKDLKRARDLGFTIYPLKGTDEIRVEAHGVRLRLKGTRKCSPRCLHVLLKKGPWRP